MQPWRLYRVRGGGKDLEGGVGVEDRRSSRVVGLRRASVGDVFIIERLFEEGLAMLGAMRCDVAGREGSWGD
jgi:hypothetical protein